jgi:hypothetical protein
MRTQTILAATVLVAAGTLLGGLTVPTIGQEKNPEPIGA